MNNPHPVIVLVSGGMDSAVALHHAQVERNLAVRLGLSFHYGSKHNDCEIPFAAVQCESLGIEHRVIDLAFINQHFRSDLLQSGGEIPEGHYEEISMQQTVVPFRNGILLSIAVGLAESLACRGVVIAAHGGDHAIYPDCREPFMQAMQSAMQLGTYAKIDLLRPFINLDKAAIAARGEELGVDFSRTWSCYKGGDRHCGQCGTCVERREAFIEAGIEDPTDYRFTGPLPKKPN